MAAKRYRQGLGSYSPKRAQAARARKRPGPRADSKLGRRLASRAAAKGRLPKPGTAAAQRRYSSFVPDTEETRWLKRAALGETLSREGPGPYSQELRELGEKHYRAAYNAQRREKKKDPERQRKLSWTWVKRHKRRLRGR